jgi:hypothetical protein
MGFDIDSERNPGLLETIRSHIDLYLNHQEKLEKILGMSLNQRIEEIRKVF